MNKNLSLYNCLNEAIITPPNIPDTLNFWHGGNLEDYNDIIAQKNGRYEYGPGLYLTTHYDTARKYAKGNRKMYLITVKKGNDLNDTYLDINVIFDFIKIFVTKSKRKEVIDRLSKFNKDGKVKAYIFNNILLNENALTSSNTKHLRQFLINNGIDYEIVNNPFGWGETMMVLYDMKKIVNVILIKSTDEIDYDALN